MKLWALKSPGILQPLWKEELLNKKIKRRGRETKRRKRREGRMNERTFFPGPAARTRPLI